MSIEVLILGANTREIEELIRSSTTRVTSAGIAQVQRLLQPGVKPPHVLVLDLRDHPQVPPTLGALRQQHQETGVVIVAQRLEPSLMLEAMRAGVTEFVAEPLRAPELHAAIDRIVGGRRTAPAGEVFAIVGAKGGVGTTTLAVNIATVLSSASRERGTVLVDLQPWCGDAALFLGVEARFSMADAIDNVRRLDDKYLKGLVVKSKAGPDVLASSDRATLGPADPAKVMAVVAAAARAYRYVVLDVPRADASTLEALQLASSITVVTTQDLSAIRSANRLAAALKQRFGGERVRLVISRFDSRAEISEHDLERAIGGQIGHTFPSNYRAAVEALNKGRPIVVDNHSKLANAFTDYARSLAGLGSKGSATKAPSGSLLARLTGRH